MTNSRVSNFSVNKNNILGKLSDFYECCLAKYKLGNKENLPPLGSAIILLNGYILYAKG